MARSTTGMRRTLDSFDRAILRILQRDNKTPQRRIAEAVNLSAAAVQRRIAALEAAGIIDRNVAIVDTRAVVMTITAIVEVQMINEHRETADAARALFMATPEEQRRCADDINQWMVEGKLKANIDRVMPLSETAAAHRLQEESTIGKSGQLSGKLVLKP